MNWVRAIVACATVGSAEVAVAQDVKPLLGVPFGGVLKLTTRCPFNSDQSKVPCWIGEPFFYKPTGSTTGSVHLPGPDQRPAWAAHAMFKVTLDKAKRVQELQVRTFRQNRKEIADSISLRFGAPHQNELKRADVGWAHWKSPEGTAAMNCSEDCLVTFRTTVAQAEYDAEMAERAKKDAARPKAP